MSKKEDLAIIKEFQKDITLLGRAAALMQWDEEVGMPSAGLDSRAEGMAFLSKMSHDLMISDTLFEAVKRLTREKLEDDDKVIVRKLSKNISKARKFDRKFVEEMARATTLGSSAWRRARKKNDFEVFKPYLEKIVDLKKEEARIVGFKGHPYNGLLDDFEEGMTVEKLSPILDKLKGDLIYLLRRIEVTDKYKKQKKNLLKGKFDKSIQMAFVEDVVERMGMESEKTRVDFSEHPFTTKIGFGDVRITTNVRDKPLFAFLSTVHEAGHALYELGMPEDNDYDVLGDAPSVGLHESQSRFWEIMIAHNKPFWRFYYPKFKKQFGLKGGFEDWFNEVNFIEPGKIRIESDEIHYCLHIILRFEIEKGLIDGSIKVKDLPAMWDMKMKAVFGIEPENYVEGVLQDVHWSQGYFGYFPTYAIGTMYAAQLYKILEKKHPNVDKEIAKGDFKYITEWLRKNVHSKGSRDLADDVIRKVCGKGLDPDVFVDYLTDKYKKLYGFE